jgi:hypothetical protein
MMAILRVPRITTAQRASLLLLEGEIVFDVDEAKFYGGDGITVGGFQICSGDCGGGPVVGDLLLTQSGDTLTTEGGDLLQL